LEYRFPWLYERLFVKTNHQVIEYSQVVNFNVNREYPDYRMFYCPVPGWDNTARREVGALIIKNSTPQLFEHWVQFAAKETKKRFRGEEQLLFINAWNEWAEGCHLEPDQRWGHEYLRALARATNRPYAANHHSMAPPHQEVFNDFEPSHNDL